jgi:hypothetical protein
MISWESVSLLLPSFPQVLLIKLENQLMVDDIVAMDLMGILASTPGSQYGLGGYLLRPSNFHGRCNWLIWSAFHREAEEFRNMLDSPGFKLPLGDGWRADRVAKVFQIMLHGQETDPNVKKKRYQVRGPGLNSLHAIDDQISDGWIGDESLADTELSAHGNFMSVIGLHVHTLTKEFPNHPNIAAGTNPVLGKQLTLHLLDSTQEILIALLADVGVGPNVEPSRNHSLIMSILFDGIRAQARKDIKGAERAVLWTCLIYRALSFHRLFKFHGPANAVPLRYQNDYTTIYIE